MPPPEPDRTSGASVGWAQVSPVLLIRTLSSAFLGLGSLRPHRALAIQASLVSYAG